MTVVEVNELLGEVSLTHPVELTDIEALREVLSDTPGLSVFHRVREVVVRIYRAEQILYERTLIVQGAPAIRKMP